MASTSRTRTPTLRTSARCSPKGGSDTHWAPRELHDVVVLCRPDTRCPHLQHSPGAVRAAVHRARRGARGHAPAARRPDQQRHRHARARDRRACVLRQRPCAAEHHAAKRARGWRQHLHVWRRGLFCGGKASSSLIECSANVNLQTIHEKASAALVPGGRVLWVSTTPHPAGGTECGMIDAAQQPIRQVQPSGAPAPSAARP